MKAPHQLGEEVASLEGGAAVVVHVGRDADADLVLVQRVDRGRPAHSVCSLTPDQGHCLQARRLFA